MAAGEFIGSGSDSGPRDRKEYYKGLLRELKPEELLDFLSEGFCDYCEDLFQTRLQNILQKAKLSGKRHSTESNPLPHSRRSRGLPSEKDQSELDMVLDDGLSEERVKVFDNGLSEAEKERIRYSMVETKKDFVYLEKVNGTLKNVLQGLELHTGVFNAKEQHKIVKFVYKLQRLGRGRMLKERTYAEPLKWKRGKGRVNMQFGCCYNYAVDRDGNPPGILRDAEVDPLPSIFVRMIKRMVSWNILPATCVPNSCIVNIYEEGDCIPPHIDHHDFLRPFCTVSFLAECNILFGSNLKIVDAGEFSGPVSIPLPLGSVLVPNGNGADVAKHCVPAVPAKRISITFRRMDDTKTPYKFSSVHELEGIRPLIPSPLTLQNKKVSDSKVHPEYLSKNELVRDRKRQRSSARREKDWIAPPKKRSYDGERRHHTS